MGSVWYQKRVTWKYGRRPWETSVTSPDGKQHYGLVLQPLWAVEGGIVAILLASPERPNVNLLGPDDNNPHPFVIEVEELQRGIGRSRFGSYAGIRVLANGPNLSGESRAPGVGGNFLWSVTR